MFRVLPQRPEALYKRFTDAGNRLLLSILSYLGAVDSPTFRESSSFSSRSVRSSKGFYTRRRQGGRKSQRLREP